MFSFKKKVYTGSQDSLTDKVYNKIREILPFDLKNILLTNETTFESLGLDSIQFINLLYSLEDIVEKDLEEIANNIEIGNINTVGSLVELVKKISE